MSILSRPEFFGTHPGEVAPTTDPGEPETRRDNDSTERWDWTRLSFKNRLLGGVAVVTTLIAGFAVHGNQSDHPGRPETSISTGTPEQTKPRGEFDQVPHVFFGKDGQPFELRRDQIKLPETRDPDTFEEAFASIGDTIQYYVTTGDIEGLRTVVPGTFNYDAMAPGQLQERAAFIERYRRVMGDPSWESRYDTNPENHPRNYGWGMQVKLLEQTSAVGANIKNTGVVHGRVRVAIGDYRPRIDGNDCVWAIEEPYTYETDMIITRYKNLASGERLPDNGWMVYQMKFPKLPERISETPPEGFEDTPFLYPGLGIK